ncbi:peroxisomal biogenesis factor 3 [Dermatophagoides pteronyssinus]|uniref:peroxisomal biogenesis factor 3 n=1 Tax=Dermatophagoides pteronyssinus TaxID=6956 RepID=UPI003F66D03F
MQSTWNFIKNNKKTIFFTTSAIVGFIGLRKYFSNFEQQWQNSQSRNFVSEVRKKGTYFDDALNIGTNMANKQFGLLIKRLKEMFNIVKLLEQIKEAQSNNLSPSEQLKYYEELKIEIFTYIIAEIYSIAFLITYLRVQLSMISGVMYHENQINQSTTVMSGGNLLKDTTSRYYMFIGLMKNFHQNGIEHLVDNVRILVKKSFKNLKITNNVTLKDLLKNFNEIKFNWNESMERLIEENVLIVYRLERQSFNDNDESIDNNENLSNNKILNEYKACTKFIDEMIDITKLSDFRMVLENCIDIGYSNLFDFINECFIQFERQKQQSLSSLSTANKSMMEQRSFINPHQINILLIKLLPLIWQQVHNSDDDDNDGGHNKDNNQMINEFCEQEKHNRNALLVQYLLCSDSLTCFAANIYEAFCNEMPKCKTINQ